MPELPEVETVCCGLEKSLKGRKITSAEIFRHDLRFPVPDNFARDVKGATVEQVKRRGKYIISFLSNSKVMIIHLGMSGRIKIHSPNDKYEILKHDHMVIRTDDGSAIIYNDPRRFGMLLVADNDRWDKQKPFINMGPEPLDYIGIKSKESFDAAYLVKILARRKTPIKTALLDQNVVAGLGNIYVCEALYISGISPLRPACSITNQEAATLVQQIRLVLEAAIKAGGSTLKDYKKTDGSLGYFQHQFCVYDREGEKCPECTCKGGGIEKIVQAGRSTFFCPHKQR